MSYKKLYESWNIKDCKGLNYNRKRIKFFKRLANKVTRQKLKQELIA